MPEPTDLTALRAAARTAIDVPGDAPGDAPVRWRVVSIEYGGGIAPVCTASSFTLDADLGGTTQPTHQLDADVFGPDARDDLGLYDCCPRPWIEVWSEEMAAYLVALLNGDAEVVRPSSGTITINPDPPHVAEAIREVRRAGGLPRATPPR
jgi:hypothetical protein